MVSYIPNTSGIWNVRATISQKYYWPRLRNNIHTHIKVYNNCQNNNKQNLKYVKLPAKETEAIPLDRISVDLIGPLKIRIEGQDEPLILKVLPMSDMATGWF